MVKILCTFAVVVALWIGYMMGSYFLLLPRQRPFDPQLWRTCERHSDRYAMHWDLLKRYKVIGMKKQQLIELLGKPDGESETELSWDLGQYFGADDSAIDFKLKDGKVVDVTVWGF